MPNYSNKENLIKIMQRISKKVPQGIMLGNAPVGHIEWQMYLQRDYLKLDGTPLANASNDYDELLKFAQDNSLITSDTTDKSLFKYDSTTDVLTLPNYIDLVLQGGNSVEEKEAGLPNITSKMFESAIPNSTITDNTNTAIKYNATFMANKSGQGYPGDGTWSICGVHIDASNSNSIYGNSTTVQPPAITLIPQIKYKKSTTVWETVDIGKFVATSPVYYERSELPTPNKTTITIHNTWVNINGKGYVLEGEKVIDLTNSDNWDDGQYTVASNRAGKDFYIYACELVSDVAPKFILSANSTIPTGYTANTSRKIGGFHCLCLSVGTISGHTLSGYVTGDILPQSAWDLNHRAVSENEGMVWIPQIGLWADIYDGSWNGSKLVSVYNGVPVTGTSSKAMHGLMMAEEYGLVNKRLPTYDEFIVCAKGSPEGSHISTAALPSGAGGHVDNNSVRIISNYGLEDCTGVLWQWSSTLAEHYGKTNGSSTSFWDTNNTHQYMAGYEWQDISVYNSTVDTVKRGSCVGLLRQLVLGGDYGTAVSYCGSRAVYANNFGSRLGPYFGGRGFACER